MIPSYEYISIMPEVALCIAGLLIMLVEPLFPKGMSRKFLGILAFFGVAVALYETFQQNGLQWSTEGGQMGSAFFGMLQIDHFSIFFHCLVLVITGLVILFSLDYVEKEKMQAAEYYALLLFGAVGMCLMSSAQELVMVFVALETSSIASYVLCGMRRKSAASSESSIKYFLLGSFATAFFLYGVALIFGATGTTNIGDIARNMVRGQNSGLIFLSLALMFVGMAFKVSSVPFHTWTPDVYEGAPLPIVAWMSTAPKAAAFAVMLRVLFAAFGDLAHWWQPLLWTSALLSMTIGNFGALVQSSVKRMLAYSSIAHAGYILVALAAMGQLGAAAAIFYTATYAAMNVGAFAVVTHLAGEGEKFVTIDDYRGLARRSPALALALTVFMLSLIGIPLTGGFMGKYLVFQVAIKANLIWLTIFGVANSAIAAYYYLRVIVVMYMQDPVDDTTLPAIPKMLLTALVTLIFFTFYLGILPVQIIQYTISAGADLLVH